MIFIARMHFVAHSVSYLIGSYENRTPHAVFKPGKHLARISYDESPDQGRHNVSEAKGGIRRSPNSCLK